MPDLRDQQWWEDFFSIGGGWEMNGGRRMTQVFAEHFTQRLQIDRTASFSLLDMGCALGDAIRHFSAVFPNATLHGVDFSKTAIERCRTDLKKVATFEVMDIEHVQGQYDIIYCSNSLEHFEDYAAKARKLLGHCQRLCILVPYREMIDGRPLHPDPNEHHQATFYRDSFDFLVQEGLARHVSSYVFSCPGVWGWTWQQKVDQTLRNLIRPFLGKPRVSERKQIFFDITKQ
jgi:SAM-dependent methyltransferase